MMRQLFISFTGQLQPRWLKAFPNAEVMRASDSSTPLDMADIIWLDISRLQENTAQTLLKEVAGTGQSVVVMTNKLSEPEARWVMRAGAVGYCHYLAHEGQLIEIFDVVQRGGLWVGEPVIAKDIVCACLSR